MDAIAKAAKDVINSEAYQKYIKKQPHGNTYVWRW